MKKLMSLFLALLMVFTLLPVSVLADNDADGDPSAEIMTQNVEDWQPEPEEDPTENPGETPEEKAEENPEDETAEAGLIAFLGADSRDEALAYHYRTDGFFRHGIAGKGSFSECFPCRQPRNYRHKLPDHLR